MTVLGLVRTRTAPAVCRSCGHAAASAEGRVTYFVRRARHVTTCRRWIAFDMIDEDHCWCDDPSHRH